MRSELIHALTAFDAKQAARARKNPRAYHNPYALAQYIARVDDIMWDIANGATPHDAICAGFTPGPLRKAALKAIGSGYDDCDSAGNYKGLPVYKPASERE
jgi:hypothetical protein